MLTTSPTPSNDTETRTGTHRSRGGIPHGGAAGDARRRIHHFTVMLPGTRDAGISWSIRKACISSA